MKILEQQRQKLAEAARDAAAAANAASRAAAALPGVKPNTNQVSISLDHDYDNNAADEQLGTKLNTNEVSNGLCQCAARTSAQINDSHDYYDYDDGNSGNHDGVKPNTNQVKPNTNGHVNDDGKSGSHVSDSGA